VGGEGERYRGDTDGARSHAENLKRQITTPIGGGARRPRRERCYLWEKSGRGVLDATTVGAWLETKKRDYFHIVWGSKTKGPVARGEETPQPPEVGQIFSFLIIKVASNFYGKIEK